MSEFTDPAHGHVPVLAEETLDLLAPAPGETLLDATLGRGGHAELLIPHLAPGGRYVGLDLDPGNIDYARQRLEPLAAETGVRLDLVHASFQDARSVLDELDIDRVHGLLADLGFASTQMDEPGRGLSFAEQGPLDMRLDPTSPGPTAADLVNRLPPHDLANLIYRYGEERLSRRIARKIVERREESPIQTTAELAQIVRQAYGPQARRSRIHPATRTFMALRIAVNGELDALDRLLSQLPALLRGGGRTAIISFHSLEDRRVKQAFQRYERDEAGRRLTRKPITPGEQEELANPRSRSAKLRGCVWQAE
ncbi:MAG: 16S rRNA (cytosine(1402)-N(4))-methyltransferase RsmH [Phycisphaeraceae bacterium]